jgi:hypothetical protein
MLINYKYLFALFNIGCIVLRFQYSVNITPFEMTDPEGGGSTRLRNIGNYLPVATA